MSTEPSPTLDDLRQRINAIDDGLHDLIMQRADVARQIGTLKDPSQPAIRPAREAAILRRLCERHAGPLPKQVVVHIWREMIAALTRLQGTLTVAVHVPDDRRSLWDLARDHYGSATPMTAVDTAFAAVRAVADGRATVGVVPFPADHEPDPWWRFLAAADPKLPKVVARLPFLGRPGTRPEDGDALAIALIPLEPTGEDATLISVEVSGDMSRSRLKDALEATGLRALAWSSTVDPGNPVRTIHLVEVADFVTPGDTRLTDTVRRLAPVSASAAVIGGYAVPIQPR